MRLARQESFMGNEQEKDTPAGVREVATLAGGCFWCLEAVFDELKGVLTVESGYSGGTTPHPTYAQVCSGETGHAEAVQVTFDPGVISYHDLLTVFFAIHDPTSLNRQGADIGTQYRSAIFHHSPEQQQVAMQVMEEITQAGIWQAPLVTELVAFDKFHLAEDYHQEYFRNNSAQPYCRVVIAPKVAKFRQQFVQRLKK
jgi:peptide-methionine (S)-S-oxide reductase